MMMLLGCSSTRLNIPNQQLPPFEVKQISSMNEIGLEWQSFANYDIDGFDIFRKDGQNFKKIATLNDKYATHFNDRNLNPNSKYYYRIQAFGKSGFSNDDNIIEVQTLESFDSVPFAQAISDLPNRIKLIWRPHPESSVDSYLIMRREKNGEFKNLATVKGRLAAEYIDKNVQAGKEYEYLIYAKSGEIFSKPSGIISSSSKSRPPSVQNLRASSDQPKKIVLTWDALPNFDGYYQIYSSSSDYLPFTKLAQTKANSYTDLINDNGSQRIYRVTFIEKQGLESLPSENVAGFTLGTLAAPLISQAYYQNGLAQLSWEGQAQEYIIIRTGNGVKKIFPNIIGNNFSDANLPAGTYEYSLIAVDEYGLESPSSKATIKVQ